MEERLERILSQIDGAGQVQVMITWKSDGEKVVEKDRKSNEENVSEKDSQGGSRTTSSHDTQETTVYNSCLLYTSHNGKKMKFLAWQFILVSPVAVKL